MKYIVDLPEEVVEKANPFEGEIGSALHDAICLDSFIEGIKGEIAENGNSDINTQTVLTIIDKHMGKENE